MRNKGPPAPVKRLPTNKCRGDDEMSKYQLDSRKAKVINRC